jgi:hypothetical protein
VVFSGVGKIVAEMDLALEASILEFNVGSSDCWLIARVGGQGALPTPLFTAHFAIVESMSRLFCPLP